jgi:radical SAM protein with 4Fe4S-binding SPASM domain
MTDIPSDNHLPPKNETAVLRHPHFGDLRRHLAVNMELADQGRHSITLQEFPYIHLSITGRCYARCRGCVNAAITSSYKGDRRDIIPIADTDPERDVACLTHLIGDMEVSPVTICLYGGEPLLEMAKIARVYDLLAQNGLPHQIRYMLYTNGDLLKKAVAAIPAIMADIWLYTISIDGRQEQHDTVRLGTDLAKIHAGLRALNAIRRGTVIMWSTLREEQSLDDCYEEFLFLYRQGLVDHFYFHWVETAEPFIDLENYGKRYQDDLHRIMNDYVSSLQKGKILPIVHINELVVYLLTGHDRGSSACGVELAQNYDLIDGKIHSCADLPPELALGTIDPSGKPLMVHRDLTYLVQYKDELRCRECGVHAYCGGRCPVQAYSGGAVRMKQYCQLMRLHVGTVKEYLGAIETALRQHSLAAQDLYDASGLYARFTDVTP